VVPTASHLAKWQEPERLAGRNFLILLAICKSCLRKRQSSGLHLFLWLLCVYECLNECLGKSSKLLGTNFFPYQQTEKFGLHYTFMLPILLFWVAKIPMSLVVVVLG
jgi:hypothetical protein